MRHLTALVQTALLSLDLEMRVRTGGFTAAAAFGKVEGIWLLLVVHAGRWTGWSQAPDASTPKLRLIFGRIQRKLGGRKQARCLRELYLMRAQDQSPLPTLSAGSGD
ncbi:hypothetical protein SGGMMB4_05777 (plasmid) [Sodalis glossinidius str. 'morsitans']|uniref:Uncharacterized protein n=1 Tax=Sodalis glossinidius (strain morsitans) TaxID=343509 RepID=A0A193QPE9_SODGM|nr:hypothetical protein SGGMMB4_05777 [Sodalis glossinidius str. 'morsitans']